MPLEYTIKGADGNQTTVNVEQIADQMRGRGENVTGIAPDGTITVVDSQGELDINPTDFLQKYGWTVGGMKPTNANFDMADTGMRTAISLLPDDEARRFYLETTMQRRGVENPQIMGNDRDWFVYDPEGQQFYGLTNNPDWDVTDVGEFAAAVPRAIGAIGGGIAGGAGGGISTLGLGTIPGAMLGAAGGGLAGDAAARSAMAAYDPVVLEAFQRDPGALVKDMAVESVLDAAGAGMVPIAGKVAGPVVQKALQTGPISTIAKGVGGMAESGGRMIQKGAGFVGGSRLGKEIASFAVPGAGEAVGYGALAQLPGMAVRGMGKGLQKLGQTGVMQKYAPKVAEQMKLLAKSAARRSRAPGNLTGKMTQTAEEFAAAARGEPYKQMASRTEDFLGNIGEMIGSKVSGKSGREAIFRYARKYGLDPETAMRIARGSKPWEGGANLAEEMFEAGVKTPESLLSSLQRPAAYGEIGRKIGRGIQSMEDFGRGLENVGVGATGAALKTAQYGGQALGKAGLAAKLTGTVTQPLETRLMARYGSEELLRPKYQRSPWQSAQVRDKMYMAAQ